MTEQRIRSRSTDRASTHPGTTAGRNLITIASGKGGVGKTWFAITLAHALAKAKRKVLLFDGDLGLANVDIQLGLTPAHDLGEVVLGQRPFEDVVSKCANTGFDVVAGRSGSARMADARGEQIELMRRGLLTASRLYDDVILDLGAGVDRGVRTLAANAGPTVVVTTDEPTAMTDAYALIKLLKGSLPGDDFRILVNMCDSVADGERTFEKLSTACQNFLAFKPSLAGIITRDPHVPDAIRRQVPLMTRHPMTSAAEQVIAIARGLVRKR